MNNLPSIVVRGLLEAWSLATIPSNVDPAGWPCYVENLPDQPDNCIIIWSMSEIPDQTGRTMRGHWEGRQSVKIQVRSLDPQLGYRLMAAIGKQLDEVRNMGIDSDTWLYQIPGVHRGPLMTLGLEPQNKKRRWWYSMDADMVMHELNPAPLPTLQVGFDYYQNQYSFDQLINVTLRDQFPTTP